VLLIAQVKHHDRISQSCCKIVVIFTFDLTFTCKHICHFSLFDIPAINKTREGGTFLIKSCYVSCLTWRSIELHGTNINMQEKEIYDLAFHLVWLSCMFILWDL
jgi:hypothetical protein